MTFTENKPDKSAVFAITVASTPLLPEKKDVRRFKNNDKEYKFKDLGNGMAQITISLKVSPAFRVPKWIMKMAFPHVFFEGMVEFIKYAHDE